MSIKKIILFISVCLFISDAFAQSTFYYVSGKIVDANTKVPLQAASVFAQNTTLGTATDADGNFKLALPNGGYDLVITYTGYQTESKRITTTDAEDKNIVIQLQIKDESLQNIVIQSTGEVKDGLEKYGNFFLENFIGNTANGKNCIVKNKEALKFYFSKRKNRLKVMADIPIKIANNALGYNIKYNIDSFIYEYNTDVSVYAGYPLFEEMQSTDSATVLQWIANRTKTYQGSLLHFMRSLYNKNLKEDGFEIQFLIKTDKETAMPLQNFYSALNYYKDDSTQTVAISPNQSNVIVLYNKMPPEKEYLTLNPDEPKSFQLTSFYLKQGESIIIEQNGYYYEQVDVIINQYLGWKKMADMLPFDFKP